MAESLSTIIFQELRAAYPSVDWTVGSVVRELIAEPVATLGSLADQYIQDAEQQLNLAAILRNPAQYSAELNLWMERLGLDSTRNRAASGTARIMMTKLSTPVSIMEGTILTWNNVQLTVSETTTWFISATDGANVLTYRGPNAYEAVIPVTAYDQSNIALSEGSPLNWSDAPNTVYDVCVGSAITGGRVEMTDAEKAAAIQDVLFPAAFSGEYSMNAALRRRLPLVVNSVKPGRKQDSAVGQVPVYVKTVNAPEVWDIDAVCRSTNGQIVCEIDGTGVYEVVEVANQYGITYNFQYDQSQATGDANSTVRITVDGVRDQTPVIVRVRGLKTLSAVQTVFAGEEPSTPYTFLSKLPVIVQIDLELHVAAGDTVTDEVLNELQTYISSLPLGTDALNDSTITVFLRERGITLTTATFYTARILYGDAPRIVTTTGGLSLDSLLTSTARPIAVYCFNDGIAVNYAG